MNVIKILLNPPPANAPREKWEEYNKALAEAERLAEASAERIVQILAP